MQGVQPKAKANPSRKAPPQSAARRARIEPGLAIEQRNLHQTRQMQSEDDNDDNACHQVERRALRQQEFAHRRRRSAQGHKHDGKTHHKGDRIAQMRPISAGLAPDLNSSMVAPDSIEI